jgi:ribosomal protein L20A (L18A)
MKINFLWREIMYEGWNDPKVVVAQIAAMIAAYAAIISTVNLIWAIIRSVGENVREILIKPNFLNTFSNHPIFGLSDVSSEIKITIINKKKISCTIKQPIIGFNKKIKTEMGNFNEFALAIKDTTFPITLEYGKIKEFMINSDEIDSIFKDFRQTRGLKARFIVYDSFGQKHKTKFYRQEIINCIEIPKNINKKNKRGF